MLYAQLRRSYNTASYHVRAHAILNKRPALLENLARQQHDRRRAITNLGILRARYPLAYEQPDAQCPAA